ncbi:30S ribosomal protein S17 [Texas Phoenix palm phytoplasma]|uniref:Small ribosomal subunit protein uS17 n=1 Tax=Texas Phoenix palm phytoplasma TaxID=176709 RepID=A0ABS5BIJ6_9MOLU|nr:30S ribosomal protein S17 [Texas Phoenix palm phytoplasma]MBP3059410.1 30S ribosomal protein S17 [Texas Phoenix palm phytoplasma]
MIRNLRKILLGTVVSDKMQKTITVKVDYYKKHILYGKRIKRTSKFYVHDEKEIAKIGDFVQFMETRPLSKTKKFCLLKVLSIANKENNV